jgi:hypothetical protein
MLLRLNRTIRDEVFAKIQHYGQVNYFWHGAKRVPVAFIPLGVAAVNLLGLSRLVANILRDTGMFQDPEAQNAGAMVPLVHCMAHRSGPDQCCCIVALNFNVLEESYYSHTRSQ